MKKKITIVLTMILIIIVAIGGAFLIDKNRMKNNEPIVFSTWGNDYAPPEYIGEVVDIVDTSGTNGTFLMAIEPFYADEENIYSFNCIRSGYIIVKYENGYRENVVSALQNGNIKITDLDRFNISYMTEKKSDLNF